MIKECIWLYWHLKWSISENVWGGHFWARKTENDQLQLTSTSEFIDDVHVPETHVNVWVKCACLIEHSCYIQHCNVFILFFIRIHFHSFFFLKLKKIFLSFLKFQVLSCIFLPQFFRRTRSRRKRRRAAVNLSPSQRKERGWRGLKPGRTALCPNPSTHSHLVHVWAVCLHYISACPLSHWTS